MTAARSGPRPESTGEPVDASLVGEPDRGTARPGGACAPPGPASR